MGPSSSNKNFSSGTTGTTGGTTGASQPASSGRIPSEDRSSTESANASDRPSQLPKPLMGEGGTLMLAPPHRAGTQLGCSLAYFWLSCSAYLCVVCKSR